MSTEAETTLLDLQDQVLYLGITVDRLKEQLSQWREVAILEGIALLLTIYFYVL